MGVFFYFRVGAFKLEKYIQSINAISIQRNIFYSKYLYTGESIMQLSSEDLMILSVLRNELSTPNIPPTYKECLKKRIDEISPPPPKTESVSFP